MPQTAIALMSGGLDSTTLVWSLKPEVKALLVDYNQRHRCELEHARNICDELDIEYRVANLQSLNPLVHSGSQAGDDQPPEGHYTELSMKTTIVPNRNAIMLSIAVGWAVASGVHDVYFAAHAGDHAIYPDCRAEFVDAFSRAMELGNAWSPVVVHAPFVHMTKADIVKLGAKLGVPFEMTYSCYTGNTKHCGKCGTCVERKEAFQLAGVEDPTQYA
jgi:7-cyano-7-deazaguanine synthase